MIPLTVAIRKDLGKKTKSMKGQGKIPAVVYGKGVKNLSLEVDEKEFKKVFSKAGESSLIELLVTEDKPARASHLPARLPVRGTQTGSTQAGAGGEKRPVLVHELQRDPVSDKIIHIDFFQPSLTEEVEVKIPLVFEGSALAEKDLGGTLVKNLLEIEVKALPQNLPHEIVVSIDSLKTFEDHILVKDLTIPANVTVLKKPNETVASVLPPQKIEEELAEVIEENVEDVERVEKEKKEEEVVEEPAEAAKPTAAKPTEPQEKK